MYLLVVQLPTVTQEGITHNSAAIKPARVESRANERALRDITNFIYDISWTSRCTAPFGTAGPLAIYCYIVIVYSDILFKRIEKLIKVYIQLMKFTSGLKIDVKMHTFFILDKSGVKI